MGKKAIRYAVVDAFATEPFKGNPAAVCLLEDDNAADERWMQSVATEFNLSETAFLVDLCGHATLASAHFLFTAVLPEHGMIEFMTKSGILTAKKVPPPGGAGEAHGKLFIELNFPMIDFLGCNEMPSIPETLNGAPVVSVHKSAADGNGEYPSTMKKDIMSSSTSAIHHNRKRKDKGPLVETEVTPPVYDLCKATNIFQ
uniref:Uncharacterized protein n=1 Tax=Aegilops tauschii TaxID=37682 RepID=N1QWK1_AEGTA